MASDGTNSFFHFINTHRGLLCVLLSFSLSLAAS